MDSRITNQIENRKLKQATDVDLRVKHLEVFQTSMIETEKAGKTKKKH